MGRKIVITSGKGGVGKTTITAGLGFALSNLGASVCLIDLDFGLNNLDLVLNIEDKIIYDISDCINGKCRLKQALIPDKNKDNLFYLSSSKLQTCNNINLNSIEKIINKLAEIFDYCLIDSPAGMGDGFNVAKNVGDEFIIVVTPNISSLRDASKIKSNLINYGVVNLSLIVNRIRGDLIIGGKMLDENQISKALNLKITGVIAENDDLSVLNNLKGVYDCGAVVRGYFDVLAKNINFNRQLIIDYKSGYKGFLGFLKCKFKRNA